MGSSAKVGRANEKLKTKSENRKITMPVTHDRIGFSFLVFPFWFFIASLLPVGLFRLDLRDLHEVILDRLLVSRRAGLLGGIQELLLRQRGEPCPVAGADADLLYRFGAGV